MSPFRSADDAAAIPMTILFWPAPWPAARRSLSPRTRICWCSIGRSALKSSRPGSSLRGSPNAQFAVDLNWHPCLVWRPTFTNVTKRTPMPDLKQLYDSVVSGDAKTTQALTQQALADGVDPLKLVNDYMVPAMDEVGRRFEANEYFVPELLISARAMKAALELIRPLLTA